MALTRAAKKVIADDLVSTFGEVESVIVTHNKGLTVAQVTDLRRKMRDSGALLKVAKNKLVQRAIKGTTYEPLSDLFKGPTVIAYSKDPVSAAKVAVEFAKTNEKFVLLGGAMGNTVLDVAGVKNLATMPSLDELRGKLVGLIQAPATKLATILQAPAGQLARVFGAYSNKTA